MPLAKAQPNCNFLLYLIQSGLEIRTYSVFGWSGSWFQPFEIGTKAKSRLAYTVFHKRKNKFIYIKRPRLAAKMVAVLFVPISNGQDHSDKWTIDVYGSKRSKTEHPNTEQKTVPFSNGVRFSELCF